MLQNDLDEYMKKYNNERTHQGKRCKGRTPMETFLEGKKLFNEKNLEERLAAQLLLKAQEDLATVKLSFVQENKRNRVFLNKRDVEDCTKSIFSENVFTAELADFGLPDEEEDAIVEFLNTLFNCDG